MSEPNDALAALVREAGWSWAGLARRINDLGANEGRALRYDYTAVNRWIKRGEKPRQPVPTLLAQALSERLGRQIDASEFGMVEEQSLAARGLHYSDDPHVAVNTIIDLGRADVKRRAIVTAPFVLAALGVPSRDWLLATLDETSTERGPRQVGMRQVTGIREMFALFQDMDVMRGGGHARTALVEYMQSYVLPLLKREHEPAVRQALYEAAAEQSYLVGWMAYDDGEHGLAQRYLIQALRLAEAAGSAALGAHVLAGMSDQANLLGHPREALMLARAGRRGLPSEASPACLADLYILEGRAHAALGDTTAAVASVVRSERVFGSVIRDEEPAWAKFIDAPYIFGEAAHCFRDLGRPSELERFANESSTGARLQGRARRGALSEAALSIADLDRSNIEAAATRATHVVDLAASVNSSRAIETVRDLQRRLLPFGDVHEVQQFKVRANNLLGLAA
ncbi:hypothetical protein [Salinispora arenicola]|uniref:hypothetical protein n=1 Tax=Salinispora arenicola TaxID=168697 RepID=UPI0020796CCD|nr:hypothetical protein [Salinispora arenicola]MCN0152271.1 hypothetical protein [Salinispora arenicola]